ncbi:MULTISPECIES: DUF3817 domain-containing protein [Microbacterium]|uniref:DUF3817 domain-containing protein n=1 Tax=Microbacterium TaxID=33882 RepID=UPI0012B71B86|nr:MULTISPECIES: DUF3817 domain-containing protein [Microbacterium]MTE24545.1 DUF3817 domain-containing protein [Microbacterium sp. ZXX196]NHI17640.1 DUF3817 domain-containing protein [Microbacterium excoecariae]
MPQPRIATFPQIRRAVRFYQITSVITGVGLLLLCAEMVMKYGFHVELFLNDPQGFLAWREVVLQGDEWVSTGEGLNLSLGILIAHGWFYVVYILACFRVWSLMRWPFWRLIMLFGGGVVPFLSFIMEFIVARDVKAYLSGREERLAEKKAAAAAAPTPPTEEAAR